jgi:hypothetical protein
VFCGQWGTHPAAFGGRVMAEIVGDALADVLISAAEAISRTSGSLLAESSITPDIGWLP